MSKRLIGLKLLAWALVTPALAVAAPAAELKLIGTITPGACEPRQWKVIDYGVIPANTLSATEPNKLPVRIGLIEVFCEAPVKFAIGLRDERSATTVTSLETSPDAGPAEKFGLGATANGENIGAYSLRYAGFNSEPAGAAGFISSLDGGVTWMMMPVIDLKASGELYAMSKSASVLAPSAYSDVRLQFNVYATIDKIDNLSITDTIDIDGLATFEVKYL